MRILGLTLLASVLFTLPCAGQTTLPVPKDTKMVMQLDVNTFAKTDLGTRLVSLIQKIASKKMSMDEAKFMSTIEQTVGFDPFTEIQTVSILVSDYESPEEDFSVALQMKTTTGNLEGLMLALPGYNFYEKDDVTIHTTKDDKGSAFAAFLDNADGSKRIVVAAGEEGLTQMLQRDQSPTKRIKRQVNSAVPEGAFAQLQIFQFPNKALEIDPANNFVVKLVDSLSIVFGEAGSDITADVTLTAIDEKMAEQFQQLVQGFTSIFGLIEQKKESNGDDEADAEMAKMLDLLDGSQVERSGKNVTIHLKVPVNVIIDFIRDEAGLPL